MLTIVNETEMGYMLGASEYVTKPIDRDRLAAALKKYQVHGAAAQVLLLTIRSNALAGRDELAVAAV